MFNLSVIIKLIVGFLITAGYRQYLGVLRLIRIENNGTLKRGDVTLLKSNIKAKCKKTDDFIQVMALVSDPNVSSQ